MRDMPFRAEDEMYPSAQAMQEWRDRRSSRDVEAVIASNPQRYPRILWTGPKPYAWAGRKENTVPQWTAWVGGAVMGWYYMAADLRAAGIVSGGHPEREAPDLADWRPHYPFKEFLPQGCEAPVSVIRKIAAFGLYDWLDDLLDAQPRWMEWAHEPYAPQISQG